MKNIQKKRLKEGERKEIQKECPKIIKQNKEEKLTLLSLRKGKQLKEITNKKRKEARDEPVKKVQ